MNAAAELLAQALAAHRRGELDAACRLYAELLARDPGHAGALHLLGVADYQQGRLGEALARLDRALALAPGLAAAHANRAAVLRDLGRPVEALASAERSLAIQPGDARALNNRAAALLDLGRAQEALDSAEQSLAIDAHDAAAWHNRGNAALALRCLELALASYDAALALDAGAAASHEHRGQALEALGRTDEAVQAYGRALALDARRPGLFDRWLHAKLRLADWSGLDLAVAAVREAIAAGLPVLRPFVALSLPLTRREQQHNARAFVRSLGLPPATPLPPTQGHGARLRLGFFSADFREHPTARLIAGLLEQLPRDRLEVTAFAFGPPADDSLRRRIQAGVEHFVEVSSWSDEEVVQVARQRGTQIAIDLGGPTRDARPGLFARRVAPLQLSWLGFPGTQGAPWIDVLLADPVVLPPGHDVDYDETVVRLPHCYQANDDRRVMDPHTPSRESLGLPATGFVFCAFHPMAKIGPEVFERWCRLLAARPGSMLWLLEGEPGAMPRLRSAAAAHGIDPARLVFAPRRPAAEHLARQRAADLFLDTFAFNAHTSASDALWAGLPVLTCCGETFAARVAASLLHAVGLPELVTTSPARYEARALALSAPGSELAALRERLIATRERSPLFDTARFARAFDVVCSALWERHAAGLPLRPLQVLDDGKGDLLVVEQAAVAEAAGGLQPGGGQ